MALSEEGESHSESENNPAEAIIGSFLNGQTWFSKLALVLVGYGCALLPGYLLVRWVTWRCKEDDRAFRTNSFLLFLRRFAIGRPDYRLVSSLPRHSDKGPKLNNGARNQRESSRLVADCLHLLVYFAGIQSTLICMGFFQERIITCSYRRLDSSSIDLNPNSPTHTSSDFFSDAQFLVFANRLVALVLAGGYLLYTRRRQPAHIPPLWTHSLTSLSNTISSWCQYEALHYVSFPTQTVCKASKVIPTMVMGWILRRERYSAGQYALASVLVTGASLFFLSISTGGHHIPRYTSPISGFILMACYLLLDAFTPNYQKKLLDARVSTAQMMFAVNAFSCVLCMVSLLQQGTLVSSLAFLASHEQIFRDCLLLSLGSAFGQIFIYATINRFGPVCLSVMMTLRQIFSIMLSSLYFNHPITIWGAVGLMLVFGSILADTSRRYLAARRNGQLTATNTTKASSRCLNGSREMR